MNQNDITIHTISELLFKNTFIYLAVPGLSWRRQWQPTPVLLPGKSPGWRSLVGCSPWGHKELDTTERLHFHFSLSCIGEGNGNPLQCSCLENPRDEGAWWAAVYGVAQSRTRLRWLSSSSSRLRQNYKICQDCLTWLYSLFISPAQWYLIDQVWKVNGIKSFSPSNSVIYFTLHRNLFTNKNISEYLCIKNSFYK